MLHGRFAAAFAGVVGSAVGLATIGFALTAPHGVETHGALAAPEPAPSYDQHVKSGRPFPESSWGTAIEMGKNPDGSCNAAGPCTMQVVLGPVSDPRRRYEVSFMKGQAYVTGVLVTRERDLGSGSLPDASLEGQTMASCGVHLQGEGVNAIVISRKSCVPPSAAKGAIAWARFENLTPYVRVIRFLFNQEPLRHHRHMHKRR
jgi:hypothetical protein